MTGGRRLASVLWWLALVAWVAAIVAPGAAAMVAFPRLPELGVLIPGTEAYFAGDPDAGGRFVAGYVTNPIFIASDQARLVAAIVAWLAIVATTGRPAGQGRSAVIAAITAAIASLVLGWSLLTVSPPLAEHLAAWRTAVLDGDHAAAATARAAFDPLHVMASRLMRIELAFVLAAVIASGLAATPSCPKGESP